MILYNVTAIVDDDIHKEWLHWMQTHHIKDVMATNCFISCRMLKVLESPNEGTTFCMQYIAEDLKNYDLYREEFASHLQADFPINFADKFVVFRTIMEFIDPK